MSPEQTKCRGVDRRADIWAFGCVLFEMLTGKMAFSGEGVTDTIAEIIKTDPDWNLLPTTTPTRIRTLIQRCLKKDTKQRLQAIGEARITIEELLAGKGGSDETAASTPAKRGPAFVPWIAGIAIGVVLASGAAWWGTRSGPAGPAMHFSPVTSFAGVQAQPSLSPDGRSVAYISNRDGHYNVYVGLVHGGEPVQITHDAAMKVHPSWSPDGSTLAYAQLNDFGTMDIWEVSALGGAPHKVILNATDPAWAPDGHSLLYENLADSAVWISGAAGENARVLVHIDDPGYFCTEPRLSPDGKMIAFAARAGGPYGELGIADFNTRKVRLLTHDAALVLSPAWSPDSRSIYFSSSRGGTLNIWKIGAEGSGLRQVTAGEGDDADLDVTSDGKRLVFATLRMNIGLSQFDTRAKAGEANVKVLTTDPARNEFGPAYSPDGSHIAFFTNLKGVEHESIGLADADGRNTTQLVKDSRVNLFPRWLADGSHIAYLSTSLEGNEYRSVAISGGSPQTIMPPNVTKGITLVDVGRDGRLLYQKYTGEVQAFDPRDGRTVTLGKLSPVSGFLRWSSDGKSVAYSVLSQKENDPGDGIWVTDFKSAPRQLFRGWACAYSSAVDAKNNIFFVKGKNDLSGEIWRVKWDGSALSRIPGTLPLLYNSTYVRSDLDNQLDVSPDGRYIVFQSQQVLQENLGIIDNVQ
jgi:Tol biopolymer transport system component